MTPERTTARKIVARVFNAHRNSDLRADDRHVLRAFDEVLAAKDAEIDQLRNERNELRAELRAQAEREKIELDERRAEAERVGRLIFGRREGDR